MTPHGEPTNSLDESIHSAQNEPHLAGCLDKDTAMFS